MTPERAAKLRKRAAEYERTFRKAWDAEYGPKSLGEGMFPSTRDPEPWVSKLGGVAKPTEAKA